MRGVSGDYIQTFHSLDVHFKIRILASLWTFSGAANVGVVVINNSTSASIYSNSFSVNSDANIGGQAYIPYCSSSYATNIDVSITDSAQNITVAFSSGSTSWGVR
jgi:hypothetical protein